MAESKHRSLKPLYSIITYTFKKLVKNLTLTCQVKIICKNKTIPQIIPINWLILFIFSSLIFIRFNSLNYFCFTYPTYFNKNSLNLNNKNNFLTWKW